MSARLAVLVFSLLASVAAQAETPTAKDTIDQFYRHYFAAKERTALHPEFSRELTVLMRQNEAICATQSGIVCGWQSDVNPYLDAQDYGDKLTIKNTGYTSEEAPSGVVRVEFDLMPQHRLPEDHRILTYSLLLEGGQWVVDNITYDNGANMRDMIEKENSLYREPQ